MKHSFPIQNLLDVYLRWVKDDICVANADALKMIEALLRRRGEEACTMRAKERSYFSLVHLSS
jgi:hypothetical protein